MLRCLGPLSSRRDRGLVTVNRRTMHDCLQAVIQRSQYPTCYQETDCVDTSIIADDWNKLIADNTTHRPTEEVLAWYVLSKKKNAPRDPTDDDCGDHFSNEVVMYQDRTTAQETPTGGPRSILASESGHKK